MEIKSTRHVLAVHDLKLSTEYYRDKLGLNLVWGDENWSMMQRDGFTIMLGECRDALDPHELGDHQYYAYVEVDDVDALYKEFTDKDVFLTSEIADQPWGQREFGIQTLDGHRIMFGQEMDS